MAIIASEKIGGGPFDSLNVVEVVNGFPRGDRAVDAAFVASMISSFISDGVCPDPEGRFCVTPSDDLSVAVDVGCAWARGYMITSSAPITFSLEPGHTYTIFLRQNLSERSCSVMVYADDNGWLPVRSRAVFDLVLAKVTVPSGAASINHDMISDERSNPDVCGYAACRLPLSGS